MTIEEQRGLLKDLSTRIKKQRTKQYHFQIPIGNINKLSLEEIVNFSEENKLRFRYQEKMIVFVIYKNY